MTLREFLGRLLAWGRKDQLDRELTHELQEHLELLARDLEQGGMSRDDARAAARRQLGNLTNLKEESRDAWGFPPVERLLQDLRYAFRGLRRSPGFTIAVVLTLGLGLGANTAMFAVIDRVMFRPFPYMRDPASVDRIYLQTTYQGVTNANSQVPYTRFLDIKKAVSSFEVMSALSEWRLAVGSGDATNIRKVAGVDAAFWSLFDAPPVRGRYFVAREDSLPLGTTVVVLSESFWRNDLGGEEVVGRTLKVGSLDHTIIGVAPRGFVGTVTGAPPDLFVPITTIPLNLGPWNANTYWLDYSWDWVEMLARRKSGVSDGQANADLTRAYIASRAAARAINPRVLPDSLLQPRGIAGAIRTAAGPTLGRETRVLLWTGGVALVVLLVACASVANLMVARLVRRQRVIVVRLALGVSRTRLLAQFVTESLLLSLLGMVAGLFIAQWSGALIRTLLLPNGAPFELAEDGRTLAFAAACAVGCALFTSLGPIVVARRSDLAALLKSSGPAGGRSRSRLQAGLLVAQVSLSVTLLIGAGLFVRSFAGARAVPLGFDAEPVIEVVSDWRGQEMTPGQQVAAQRRLVEAARAIPGVESVAEFNSRLYGTNTADLRVPGIDSVAALGRFNFQMASPEYFDVMRIRILRGRGFEPGDREGTQRIVVVSAAMAEVLWPGRDAIGECIHVAIGSRADAAAAECTTVVGIAENTRQQNITTDPMYMYYIVKDQFMPGMQAPLLLRMSTRDALSQLERVRRELTGAMPGDGLVVPRPLQEVVDNQSRAWRLGATLFVAFGGLALVVAIVGLYGVISYGVAGRMHELGVRSALGARPRNIVWLVVSGGVRLTTVGIGLGGGAALIASRWVEPLLFEVPARDPLTFGVVVAAMLAVAVAASLVPALRAVRADPMRALRAD